jgi:hypothetical protein
MLKHLIILSVAIVVLFSGCSNQETANQLANQALEKQGYHDMVLSEPSMAFKLLHPCDKSHNYHFMFNAKDANNKPINGDICSNGIHTNFLWIHGDAEVDVSK